MKKTTVSLFWNHICILQRFEQQFLEDVTTRLKSQGINLELRFFGMGWPEHLSEHLLAKARAYPKGIPAEDLPDMVLTTDLEIFEQVQMRTLLGPLHPLGEIYPLRSNHQDTEAHPLAKAMDRGPELLPVLGIPLCLYANTPERLSIPDFLDQNAQDPCLKLGFGGINNSAGKTITKAVWERYGKQTALNLLQTAQVTDMPIGAFQLARKGQVDCALVPSIYTMRADGKQSFNITLKEGPLVIPSYVAASQRLSTDVSQCILQEILCPKLGDFYTQQGDLIYLHECSARASLEDAPEYFIPSEGFIKQLDPTEFYEAYTQALPQATQLHL